VELCDQSFEITYRAKAVVEFADVLHPIAMIWIAIYSTGTLIILIYRTDPYCQDQSKYSISQKLMNSLAVKPAFCM